MNSTYVVLKIALGIRLYPNYRAFYLAEKLNLKIKSIYTYYAEAEMVSRSWLPTLVTPEQLARLSGADLTVLYYLYTADPKQKVIAHCFNANMSEKTFRKALKHLRNEKLIEQGTKGKMNSYTIQRLPDNVAIVLN